MFAYTALAWDTRSAAQSLSVESLERRLKSSAGGWRAVLNVPGLRVYCMGMRPPSSDVHALADNSGVVLGTIFKRSSTGETARASFGPEASRTVVGTRGRALVEQYWGRYVAFVLDSSTRTTCVVRSPAGELDCLYTRLENVQLFFSAVEHCPLLEEHAFEINWDYISAGVASLVPELQYTGLKQITRVPRGEVAIVRPDRIDRARYWHARQFVKNDDIEDPVQAAELLRETTRQCIDAWASCYQNILVMLSGGLDSSIVSGVLGRAPSRPRVTCLNSRTPGDQVSDERQYARLVAHQIGAPLIEHEYDAEVSLQRLLTLPRMASPFCNVFELAASRDRAALCNERAIQAYFLGEGGDEVFCLNSADYMCADYLHSHGMRPHAIAVALDAARMRSDSMWSNLRRGLRLGLREKPMSAILARFEVSSLLNPDVASAVLQRHLFIPDWLSDVEDVPPGKFWQMLTLCPDSMMYCITDSDRGPEVVNPLLSQPIQELCLRIPTYTTAFNGKSRGLARTAFKSYLPPKVAARLDKGTESSYFKTVWQSNLSFVTDLLMSGMLVNNRVVDREKLERALSGDFSEGLGSAVDLIFLIGIEAWLQRWSQPGTRAAA